MEGVGAKTLALRKLKEAGFDVPPFVAVAAGAEADLEKVRSELNCQRYAVRSSALIEDSKNESFAGQFMTKVDVPFEGLAEAIAEVRRQGVEYLRGDAAKFSLIIQEYIDADYSGVVFTRNPLGGREMVVEYYKGPGELVVGGRVKVEKKLFYWNQRDLKIALPVFPFEEIKKIEALFGFPQDIEWCLRDGKWYFLQARPITTLSDDDYNGYLYLDKVLKGQFFYEKTEVAEIAPRPSTFTYSLLEKLYGKGGPVDKVYTKYKVRYVPGEVLKLVGNELYVDREAELKSLLPAYSYLGRFDGKPHLAGLRGLWRSLLNFYRLGRVSLRGYDVLLERMGRALDFGAAVQDFSDALKRFLSDYELIFEINFLTEKALKSLEMALKKQHVAYVAVLGADLGFDLPDIKFSGAELKGNCLEIADEEPFKVSGSSLGENDDVNLWFEGLSNFKREFFKPYILNAQRFSRLREYGRWLTVKNVNVLRNALPKVDNVYFARVDEVLAGKLVTEDCRTRADKYAKFTKFSFSSRLTSMVVERGDVTQGVSAGEAEGCLVDVEGIYGDGKKILYTKILSPSLVKYFDEVEGIVSAQGGMLSHLSIVAREKGIPVVVGFDLGQGEINLGDQVRIDGAAGKVRKV